jgi:2-amino-4-hydroxy-6-hydroxymethyldihydropteridine diphosphokinase
MRMHQAIVALGSNVGDRESALHSAVSALGDSAEIHAVSSFYETEYEGANSPQAPYLNGAVHLSTDYTAWQFFDALSRIERQSGRTKKGDESPRIIDLDLIFFDKMIADFGVLILPHPRMHLRRFVLDPVCDVAPDWEHPVLRKSVQALRLL